MRLASPGCGLCRLFHVAHDPATAFQGSSEPADPLARKTRDVASGRNPGGIAAKRLYLMEPIALEEDKIGGRVRDRDGRTKLGERGVVVPVVRKIPEP